LLALVEGARLCQDNPSYPRQFSGECHRNFVDVHPRSKLIEPRPERIARSIEMNEARSRAMNEKSSRVAVPAFADTEKNGFT
jgi:hypothetical protein